MRAPLRRSLALAVLLTLLLSISTVGTTVVLGRGPTSTTIHGVDVDAVDRRRGRPSAEYHRRADGRDREQQRQQDSEGEGSTKWGAHRA